MPSGILFDAVARYPPGLLSVPADYPLVFRFRWTPSPEPVPFIGREVAARRPIEPFLSHSFIFIGRACFIVPANKSFSKKLFHLALWAPGRRGRETGQGIEFLAAARQTGTPFERFYCLHFVARRFSPDSAASYSI